MMPDEPISAKIIIMAIIAYRLKKSMSEIQASSSIKTLARGRSTLENEIVGDLVHEFGSAPDRAEEMAVGELAGKIQSKCFSGALGKATSTLLEKFLMSKMPSGFGKSAVARYLENSWGLPAGRQISLLLTVACSPPTTRLADAASAQAFLNNKAKQYLSSAGLNTQIRNHEGSHNTAKPISTIAMDPEFVAAQVRLSRKKLKLYAEALGLDLHAGSKKVSDAKDALVAAQDELRVWSQEHGIEYGEGIKPCFAPAKVRTYDSSWAWAIQDVICFFYELLEKGPNLKPSYVHSRCRAIARRATAETVNILRYLVATCADHHRGQHEAQAGLKTVGDALLSIIRTYNSCEQGPLYHVEKSILPEKGNTLQIKRKGEDGYIMDADLTGKFYKIQQQLRLSGISFAGRQILVTGAGPSSIGWHLLAGLLSGGAKVAVTTASFGTKRVKAFRDIYMRHSVSGSQLVVLPCNQGSRTDVVALVEYIYDAQGLGWDLDAIIPFAAIQEHGEIDQIDSNAELAHRIMLTNTIRLIGAVKRQKEARDLDSQPAQVLLPLSANHGIFGGDGLYSESKMALETLFNKWDSESWQDYLSICGIGIGWTRGTGLMKDNDGLVEAVETQLGIKTFSQKEMAANILTLLHADFADYLELAPLYADFNGGLGQRPGFSHKIKSIRAAIKEAEDVEKAVRIDTSLDMHGQPETILTQRYDDDILRFRANVQLQFPSLPSYKRDIEPLSTLQGMVDLNSVVVIAGFAELGPWGNARTRWDMEATGTFSLEGWIEMAWIMGLIKFSASASWKGHEQPPGWFDAQTGEPVHDSDVQSKYGEHILSHAGIRLVEPELWNGYNPDKKRFYQEMVLETDLPPFDTSQETAADFKREHGANCQVVDGKVYLKKGATLFVPKAAVFKTNVAGQLPTGFSPKTYGITDEIVAQVDPLTLYTLICSVEALFSAGVSDPYELYRYIHTSEVGNCIGTGVGPVKSAADMYNGRTFEQSVASDKLQETFPNTIGAWVNMLLLSANGPIRTPVGACATAIEALDTAHDLIMTGKAKFCLVGGVDDLEEHVAFEFANMKATNASDKDFAAGREPGEMSRPTASDRRGFLESQGCGIKAVCTAQLAIDMGLPIHGVVAFTSISSDKVGRSVPAPGKVVISNAKEASGPIGSPLLSLEYRKRQIALRMKQILRCEKAELARLEDYLASADLPRREVEVYRRNHIRQEANRQREDVLNSFGNCFWRLNPEISPIRGSLATWGLKIDDLNVVSFHGTSTIKNEKNECEIIQRQMEHLGRAKGNPVMSVFQKHLTGHPKGPAGAWMLNGCLQILDTGIVPGNRNADNIDKELSQYDHVAFLSHSVQTNGIKAASVFSFGFGQKGAQAIVVDPKYLFASISQTAYEEYVVKTTRRQRQATAEFEKRMLMRELFQAKSALPFHGESEMKVLVDPTMRM